MNCSVGDHDWTTLSYIWQKSKKKMVREIFPRERGRNLNYWDWVSYVYDSNSLTKHIYICPTGLWPILTWWPFGGKLSQQHKMVHVTRARTAAKNTEVPDSGKSTVYLIFVFANNCLEVSCNTFYSCYS